MPVVALGDGVKVDPMAIRAVERGGMSQFSRILRYSRYRPMDCLGGVTLPDLNSKLSVFLKASYDRVRPGFRKTLPPYLRLLAKSKTSKLQAERTVYEQSL